MKVHQIVLLTLALVLSCSAQQSIVVTSNAGNSDWWLAYAVSDQGTTGVELKDSGSYASWTPLQSSNWGYWIFNTNGVPVTFPVSLRLSAGSNKVTLNNLFSSAAPGQLVDTRTAFPIFPQPTNNPVQPTPVSTKAPTQQPSTKAPVTAAPTNAPTAAPTPAPTQAATAAPTKAPTPAPTQKATPAPTPAPTQKPTSAPTPAPTQAATPAPTQKPTSAPTPAPTQAATPAPTQKATPAPTTAPTKAAGTSAPATGVNPFAGTQYYLNPHYAIEVDSSIALNPTLSAQLSKVKNFASAFWIDRMAVIDNVTTILAQARMQAASSGKQVMVALVIYDLPDRDCAAAASNGEISCADATCAAGIATYKTGYIDPIVAILKLYSDIQVVTIIEPDSLPNLATNLNVAKCTQAATAYKTGVAYAISQLSALSNVHIYIDAAHGGWLGWSSGLTSAVSVFQEVITAAGGASKIRGFSTNVANYQPLGSMTSTDDPCNLGSQYNFAINEVKYVSMLDAALQTAGITGMRYIIDTGRNGVINSRTDCSNWCNIAKAGLGIPPTSDTSASGLSIIDAYFWVKPPGESDGSSDSQAPRYDFHCSSSDSMIPAPQAGEWFSNAFVSMVKAANPAISV